MRVPKFPVARINRALSVEIMAEVWGHRYGKDALLLLPLLVWKRHTTRDLWIEITGCEWRRRVGVGPQKYRAAKALEDLGLVEVRREGRRSLQFKLTPRVDPRSEEAKFKKRRRKSKALQMIDGPVLEEREATAEDWADLDRQEGTTRH